MQLLKYNGNDTFGSLAFNYSVFNFFLLVSMIEYFLNVYIELW